MSAMDDARPGIVITRGQVLLLLVIPLACLALQALAVRSTVPELARFYSDLGAELPGPTQLLIATGRFWFLVPLAFAVAIADLLRRPRPGSRHVMAIVIGGWLAAGLLQWLAMVAAFMPMFDILRQIG